MTKNTINKIREWVENNPFPFAWFTISLTKIAIVKLEVPLEDRYFIFELLGVFFCLMCLVIAIKTTVKANKAHDTALQDGITAIDMRMKADKYLVELIEREQNLKIKEMEFQTKVEQETRFEFVADWKE